MGFPDFSSLLNSVAMDNSHDLEILDFSSLAMNQSEWSIPWQRAQLNAQV